MVTPQSTGSDESVNGSSTSPVGVVPRASIRSGDGYSLPWSKLTEIRLKPMTICAGLSGKQLLACSAKLLLGSLGRLSAASTGTPSEPGLPVPPAETAAAPPHGPPVGLTVIATCLATDSAPRLSLTTSCTCTTVLTSTGGGVKVTAEPAPAMEPPSSGVQAQLSVWPASWSLALAVSSELPVVRIVSGAAVGPAVIT